MARDSGVVRPGWRVGVASGDLVRGCGDRLVRLVLQHVRDVVGRGLEEVDVVAGPLGEVPAVREDLVEDLRGLELAAGVGGDHRGDRLVDLVEPAVRDEVSVLAAEVEGGGVRREVVEQPTGLRVLDVEAGQPLQLALVVAGLDDLRLDPDPVAVEVGDDVELVDVEAEVVEPLDALLHPPHLRGRELLLGRQLLPQRLVAGLEHLDDLVRLDLVAQRLAGLQVEQLGEDVLGRDREVVLPHRRRQAGPQLAGLRVDEVRREAAGAAPEQHVGQRHVSPEEVREVQPHEQHHHRVDQGRQVVLGQAVAEQAPVGQREAQVLGEQRARQLLAVGVDPARHHALRHDRGQVEPLQVAEQAVLPERDVLDGLLDGVDPVPQPHHPHHVAGQATRQRDEVGLAPLLERDRPRQRDDRRVRSARDDPQRHGLRLVRGGRRDSP